MTAGGGPRDEAVPDIIVSTDGAPQPAVATVANNTPEGDEMDGSPAPAPPPPPL